MPGVLEGIRVVECAAWYQGGVAGRILAELGAEVIKVEKPGSGDILRRAKKIADGVRVGSPSGGSYLYELANRSKMSIAVDIRSAQGREVVYKLVQISDVFLTNFRQRAVESLGFGYDRLRELNERLVYVAMLGLGAEGPESNAPIQDFTAQARAGMMTAQRMPDAPPFSQTGLGDEAGANQAVAGVLGGLLARERWGFGQKVEGSLLASLLHLQTTVLGIMLATGIEARPVDRTQPCNPLYNSYRTGDDRWLVLGMGADADNYWPRFCEVAGISELRHDQRFNSLEARETNAKELVTILDRAFAQRPVDEWVKLLRASDLICSRVNRPADLLDDPQVVQNGYITEYEHPKDGRIRALAYPIKFSRTPAGIKGAGPELGEHTDQVLVEMLGYSRDLVEQMRSQGAIG